jgi:antitoxin component of MazEF toxin-antitoxin module
MPNSLDVTQASATDLSDYDLRAVQEYEDSGLPNISKIDDPTLYRMLELYLGGHTYRQISSTLNIKKVTIMYLSHKYKWYDAKREHLAELQEHMKNRIAEAKLMSQDFLLLLTQAWQKRIGRQLRAYLATDNPEHANQIDLKEVNQLMKTIELINALDSEGKDSKGKTPAVGLNLGDGVTIEKSGENKITITPKEKTIGDMLKKFADNRREEESKNKPRVHDINNKELKENTNTGENND